MICVPMPPKKFLSIALLTKNYRPSQKIVNPADFAIYPMVFHYLRQIGLTDGADCGQIVGSCCPAGFRSRLSASEANLHDLVSQQPPPLRRSRRSFP